MDKPLHELFKIPDHIIIKRLIFENEKLENRIKELQENIKILKSENELLLHRDISASEKAQIREEYKKEHGLSLKMLNDRIRKLEKIKDDLILKLHQK